MMFSKISKPVYNYKSMLFRSFGSTSQKFRIAKSSKPLFGNSSKTEYLSNAKTFKIMGAVSSATGIGIICYYATKQTNDTFSIMTKSAVWPKYVQDRIHSTYTYFALSNMVTAASAVAVFHNTTAFRYATRATIPALILGMACVIGSGILMRSISYDTSIGLKHMAWLLHCSTLGFVVAPVCVLGGQVIQRAALYTLGMVGGLSAVAVTTPSDKFLYMGVPLAMGLGLVFVSSIAGIFLNPMSRMGAAALSFQLYGGLALFGGFLLYDTQSVIRRAEMHPPPQSFGTYNDVPSFDPINNSMHIYMDTVNIFIRLATIFGMGSSKKR